MRLVSDRFDLVVLGGGSAARDAANMAMRDYDARVALVERERWGGSCPNVACSPTKAYLVAAELAHDVNGRAPVLGIETGPARVDLARVREWKESLKKLAGAVGCATSKSRASRPSPGRRRSSDRARCASASASWSADRILVATGSRTAVPPVEGIDEIDWLDHVSALDLTEVPRSLLVVGGGRGRARVRAGVLALRRPGDDRRRGRRGSRRSPTPTPRRRSPRHSRPKGSSSRANVFVQRVRQDGGEVVATIAPRDGVRRVRAAWPAGAARFGPGAERRGARPRGAPASRRQRAGSRSTSTCAPRCRASGRPAT